MINLLWLGLLSLPIVALAMYWQRSILRGEWLKDEPEDTVEYSEEAHELLEEMLREDLEPPEDV